MPPRTHELERQAWLATRTLSRFSASPLYTSDRMRRWYAESVLSTIVLLSTCTSTSKRDR